MKPSLIISLLVFSLLFSCNKADKKSANERYGEYTRGNSVVTISDLKGKVELDLCFADEDCIEPCFKGILSNAGPSRFSGWVYPEGEDSSRKELIVVTFAKNEIDLLFPQRKQDWLGMSCEPDGVYKK